MSKKKLKNVTQRSDGRYVARKVFINQPDGIAVRKVFYGSTQIEAARKLLDYEQQVESGLNVESSEMTFKQWLKTWLFDYKRNSVHPTTYDNYEYFVTSRIIPVLGKHKLQNLKTEHLQNFINGLKKENGEYMAAQSVKKIKCILNVSLNQAVKNGLIIRNPVEGLSLPKNRSIKKVGAFTLSEQTALLEHMRNTKFYALSALALGTGMRIGELLALKWADIDYAQREITVSTSISRSKDRDDSTGLVVGSSIKTGTTKTKAGKRTIPLTHQLMQILAEHKNIQKSELRRKTNSSREDAPVFCSQKGGYLEYKSVTRSYAKARDKAGISKLSFHSLRHSFATNAITAGLDYYYLSRIMGHTSISVTLDIYADYMPDKSRFEMEKMENILQINSKT